MPARIQSQKPDSKGLIPSFFIMPAATQGRLPRSDSTRALLAPWSWVWIKASPGMFDCFVPDFRSCGEIRGRRPSSRLPLLDRTKNPLTSGKFCVSVACGPVGTLSVKAPPVVDVTEMCGAFSLAFSLAFRPRGQLATVIDRRYRRSPQRRRRRSSRMVPRPPSSAATFGSGMTVMVPAV